jgi:hypothetical protein
LLLALQEEIEQVVEKKLTRYANHSHGTVSCAQLMDSLRIERRLEVVGFQYGFMTEFTPVSWLPISFDDSYPVPNSAETLVCQPYVSNNLHAFTQT